MQIEEGKGFPAWESSHDGASVPPRSCPWCRQHLQFHRRSQTFSWTRWSTWMSKAVLCSRAGYLMHCRRQRDGHQTPCETKADRTQRSAGRLTAYRLHLRQESKMQCDNFRQRARVSIWDLYHGNEEKIGPSAASTTMPRGRRRGILYRRVLEKDIWWRVGASQRWPWRSFLRQDACETQIV